MTSIVIDDANINAFWAYFSANYKSIESVYSTPEFQDEFAGKVRLLGDFEWEIGPGTHEPYSLTISPGGDALRLEMTRIIIAMAPRIIGWEFHAVRLPKDWDLRFFIVSETQKTMIDASAWKYLLYDYGDGVFDVDVISAELEKLPETSKRQALKIALQGIIGEEMQMMHIGEVRVLAHAPCELDGKLSEMANLKEHLPQLVAKDQDTKEPTPG